jgi:hypothetical protein
MVRTHDNQDVHGNIMTSDKTMISGTHTVDKQDKHDSIMTSEKIMIAGTRERCIVGVHDNQVGHESIMTNDITVIAEIHGNNFRVINHSSFDK